MYYYNVGIKAFDLASFYNPKKNASERLVKKGKHYPTQHTRFNTTLNSLDKKNH